MKKTYFAPETVAIKISTVGMLAQSMLKTSDSTATFEESLGHETDGDWDDEEY
jgi:hypothetical protein